MNNEGVSRRAMLAAGAGLLASPALAQSDRVTRLVVPFQAGISVDVLARALARQISAQTGQVFVVDNRPGNTGHIGTAQVARAAPEGQTLILGASSTHVVSPQVLRNLPYRPVEDFAPIALIARIPIVLVVSAALPVHSVADLVAYARQRGEEVTYSTYGVGGNMHLGSALLSQRTGIPMTHVPAAAIPS
ncbi:tripartite tricarboxylate transporter substrate binding protein [Leptolyngbya sp. 15MV]|nr:tripartite tricarboxylate transporter substrate binding protein [Leptolyngbya sp. 15MV]